MQASIAIATGETAVAPASADTRTPRWIMGARADVATIILPAVTGYLCLYAHVALGISSFLIWWFWNLTMNGPHFYATMSRTYLDREEWRERTPLLLASFAWVLVGPLALWASIATRSPLPFFVFWGFQVLWAYFHVTRQHYGFMALYQRLNGEPSGHANRFDFWAFHLLMFGPVLAWFVQFPELREALGWSAVLSTRESAVVLVTRASVVAIVALYLGRTLVSARAGTLNVPKALLLAAYLPLHLLLLLYPRIAGGYDILLFNAVVTFPHNVQYLAIVWFHNRNRYGAAVEPARYGWAVPASATVWRFLALGAVYSAVFFYARWVLEGQPVPLLPMRFGWSHTALGHSPYRMADLVFAIWIGFVFQHQYLDQRIWKISSDRRLGEDLHLAGAAA